VRVTQEEVEAHPDWTGFGDQAAHHPPLRGWLATPVCGDDGRNYGLLQLSDKSQGADFTAEDEDRIRELAAFAGAALDALRAAQRRATPSPRASRLPDATPAKCRPAGTGRSSSCGFHVSLSPSECRFAPAQSRTRSWQLGVGYIGQHVVPWWA
jgi:GAF domain